MRRCYQLTVKVSTNKPLQAALFLLFSASACGPSDANSPSIMNARFGTLSAGSCSPPDIDEVRGAIDSLQFQSRDPSGQWTTTQTISGPFTVAGDYELQALDPTGPTRVLACDGMTARWLAYTSKPASPHAGETLPLSFSPIDALSCTDSIDSAGAVQQRRWERPHGFGASASIDSTLFLLGGAEQFDPSESVLRGSSDGTLTSYETNIGAYSERTSENADLTTDRVGALAFEAVQDGASGVAVTGGVAALRPDIAAPYGPFTPLSRRDGALSPGCGPVDRSGAFIGSDGSVSPLVLTGGSLVPRVLGQVASFGDVTVIAGGLECDESGPGASSTVEIIRAGVLASVELPVKLVGATISALTGGRFLIWGYDIENCGRRPGWLVSTDGPPRIEALELTAPPPDACSAPNDTCEPWYGSAHHTATALTPTGDGSDTVLILGGLRGRSRTIANNPLVRAGCPGNGLLLTISGVTGTVSPVSRASNTPSTHRAFHAAKHVGGQVIVSGGWVASPSDGSGAPTPGAFYASADWLRLDESTRTLQLGGQMAAPRFGHTMTRLAGNRVLISGGLQPGGAGGPRFTGVPVTEIWTASPTPNGCVPVSDN